MIDLFTALIEWEYWDATLSLLVIIHLISEYGHYAWEFISGRRKTNILKDIQKHRKKSTKTHKLKNIQKDLNLIKEKLDIKNE